MPKKNITGADPIPAGRGRIREIDLLRGVAIILMVFFHLVYDLNSFHDIPISYDTGVVFYIGKIAASLFIIIAGISCTLSKNNVKRGLYVLFWAFVVTAATSFAVPGSNIVFGILHFLGISILLSPFFQRFNAYVLFFLGTASLLFGLYAAEITMPNNLLIPFGLMGESFYSADYYPLFPWFGLFLYGGAIGKLKYSNNVSLFPLNAFRTNFVDLSGQHSLTIYLVHQPLILSALYLVFTVA